jgi:hypothetical protein
MDLENTSVFRLAINILHAVNIYIWISIDLFHH